MPRAVLFDLDDTLFDHRRSARAALREVHRVHAPAVDFETFEQQHIHYLEEMHVEVLAGRVGLDEARRERFRRVFRAVGTPLHDEDRVDAVASAYRTGYVSGRCVVDGAAALLAAVRSRARIAIVSNNLLEEQQDKLRFCGLTPFVDALVVSEEVGVSKPHAAIFAAALDRLGVAPDEAVMFGDSWAADIVGACNAGIRAIWLDPLGKPKPTEPGGVTQVHALVPAGAVADVILGTAGSPS